MHDRVHCALRPLCVPLLAQPEHAHSLTSASHTILSISPVGLPLLQAHQLVRRTLILRSLRSHSDDTPSCDLLLSAATRTTVVMSSRLTRASCTAIHPRRSYISLPLTSHSGWSADKNRSSVNLCRSSLDGGDCKPVTSIGGKPVYPCGLIANSVFNDTFSQPILLSDSSVYNFTDRGITWKNEYKKYEPAGYSSPSDVSPPPNWALRYPNGYTEFPNLREDEHFQVWMRTAGLPTFRKLFFRNDDETMRAGRYRIEAYMSTSRGSPSPVKQTNTDIGSFAS